MDDYKNSDNFQRMVGCKMISPHHFHPTNGVRPSDFNGVRPSDFNFALVVLLCAFTIMSLGAFLYLLAGALVIAVLAWIPKRRRIRKESRRMAEVVARKRESLGSSRLKRSKNSRAKLKHYEPNLMPLGLRKAVRT